MKMFAIWPFTERLLSLLFLIPHKYFWYPYHLRNHVLSLLLSICTDYFVSLKIVSLGCYLQKEWFVFSVFIVTYVVLKIFKTS